MPDDVQVEAASRAVTADADAWRWGGRRWEAYFALVLASTIIYVLAEGESWRADTVAAVLLAALVPWYLLLGRRVVERTAPRPAALAYLAGTVVLSGAASVASPESSLVLFALCPQAFLALRWRGAMLTVLALNAAPALRFLLEAGDAEGVVSFALWAAVVVGFSAIFGFWVDRIIRQSTERRELIAELRATRAELAEANRRAGAMAERERLAAEIHDTLAQGFTSILMLLQAADSHLEHDPAQARRHLDLAAATARENLAEARALVDALPPAGLESSSLEQALDRLVRRLGEELGVPAEFTASGRARPLAAGAEVVLLRAAQEATANIRKHAGAAHVSVRLTYGSGAAVLQVRDDGEGFDPDAARGFGLRGMRERVAQAGGRLEVDSAPGAGTVLTVEVPA
ncbi:UNVERIFIED_ORG: signal transduction histidine kinase [Actinomadura viridilutea]|uniref:sensor histidine kinase n=1 Tax=Actinomadura rubrobrunea TaxID=115335 RepID=UPI000D28E3ED|nr:sensor histidine kinase [Actinomadura rubrobrunea]